MNPLKTSMEQMIALHGFCAEAVAFGEAGLAEISGCETEVEVHEVRCTTLGEFGDQGLLLSEDLVAAVVGRLEGSMPGTLALVLDPEDALLWASAGGGENPIARFVELGSELLSGIASALSSVLEGPVELVEPRLVEEPELAMLVHTHAPSDTLVFSMRLRIDLRDEVLAAHGHLLVEPKYLARLLSALSAAVH